MGCGRRESAPRQRKRSRRCGGSLGRREEPQADARDRVVGGVEQPSRQHAGDRRDHAPPAAEPPAHRQDRVGAHVQRAVVVAQHDAVRQGRAHRLGHRRAERIAVERGEAEAGAVAILAEGEAHGAMTETAAAVVEDDGRLARCRRHAYFSSSSRIE
jgi:hypothetical protein